MNRRHILLATPALLAGACTSGPRRYQLQVTRDDSCSCCAGWAAAMEKSGRFQVIVFDAGDPASFKRSVGVPNGFGACHTAKVEGYVIEGHVPAADILSLIEKKPPAVIGLVVPGMPRGSPGMEQTSGAKDEIIVWAFDKNGVTSKYASYAALAV